MKTFNIYRDRFSQRDKGTRDKGQRKKNKSGDMRSKLKLFYFLHLALVPLSFWDKLNFTGVPAIIHASHQIEYLLFFA